VSFVSLQKEVRSEDRAVLEDETGIVHFGEKLGDFSDTAALISLMDLIVSVDTAVAHLAGALGKPVWVVLPFSPDWRWMLHREDSPWYPTARLFRQPRIGDWNDVVRRVADELGSYDPGCGPFIQL
jgi:ADP-heptose:LPS heptosyltransferase